MVQARLGKGHPALNFLSNEVKKFIFSVLCRVFSKFLGSRKSPKLGTLPDRNEVLRILSTTFKRREDGFRRNSIHLLVLFRH